MFRVVALCRGANGCDQLEVNDVVSVESSRGYVSIRGHSGRVVMISDRRLIDINVTLLVGGADYASPS